MSLSLHAFTLTVNAEILLYPCCSPSIKQGLNDSLCANLRKRMHPI